MCAPTATPQETAVRDLFAAIDSGDLPLILSKLTDDITFIFGNNPPVQGKPAVATAMDQFLASIGELEHKLIGVWQVDEDSGTVAVEMTVVYTRLDGSSIELPCANVFELDGTKIRSFRIYMDVGPVYS